MMRFSFENISQNLGFFHKFTKILIKEKFRCSLEYLENYHLYKYHLYFKIKISCETEKFYGEYENIKQDRFLNNLFIILVLNKKNI